MLVQIIVRYVVQELLLIWQIVKKCGAKLIRAMSSTQVKKKAVSKGKKILGTVLLTLGIILLIAMIINLGISLTERSRYEAASHLGGAIRCGVLGILFTCFGGKFRKK